MKHHAWWIFPAIPVVAYITWAGCHSGDPVSPGTTLQFADTRSDHLLKSDLGSAEGSRMLLGVFHVAIDERGGCTIRPARQAETHFDVTGLVFSPTCTDCFTGSLISREGEDWTFEFTLRKPTGITGYDVRATILDMGGISLDSEPDSYTRRFASPTDPTPRNPCFIFDSGVGNNRWGPMASGSRTASFTRPEGAKFSEIDFVVDASWPGNQAEPVRIGGIELTSDTLRDDGRDSTDLSCDVQDWQDDVDWVTVDLTPIGGDPCTFLTDNGNGSWSLDGISASPGTSIGIKTLWITAYSGFDAIYNRIDLTVEEAAGPPADPVDWTILVYLHASDLPDDEDIDEMEVAGSLDGEMDIIVLWDVDSGTDSIVRVIQDPEGFNLEIISEPIDDGGAVIPPGGLDMSDGATLEAFLVWAMEEFPANHYLLDLWDHGSGIFIEADQPQVLRNVCGGLSLWEIREACQNALDEQTLVDKFDIIGFDVCYLGWIETAYALRDVADIVIASENMEPGGGWEYSEPLGSLRHSIDTYTAEELAYDVVEFYLSSYTLPGHPYHIPTDECTQAASSTSELVDNVVPALDTFAEACIDILPDYLIELDECRDATSCWGTEISDIGHFAQECAQHAGLPRPVRNAAQDVVDAVEGAMIHHGHNAGVPEGESGWKIWFPSDISEADPNRIEQYFDPGCLGFGDTKWDEFLRAFCDDTPATPAP